MDFSSHGTCGKCGKSTRVEADVDGKNKVCKNCLMEQFENYKKNKSYACSQLEHEIKFYKQKIESLTPKLNENLENINRSIDEIEQNYDLLIKMISQERYELLKVANECKNDNTKFFEFKNELNKVSSDLKAFRDSSKNSLDANVMKQLIDNFEKNLQDASSLKNKFTNLTSEPIKTVDKYERGGFTNSGVKLLGNIYTKNTSSKIEDTSEPMTFMKSLIKELNSSSLAKKTDTKTLQRSNYEKWMALSNQTPTLNLNIDHNPVYLASHCNHLFIVNEKFECTIISVNETNNFKTLSSFKIPVPNVRSIAVSQRYFGITYSDLDRTFLEKNKAFKPNGIVLYERNHDTVNVKVNKIFELDRGDFQSPVGIALDDSYVYVCDEKLKAVFKIDIQTGESYAKFFFAPSAGPYRLALNNDYLIVTDPAQHLLNVYDVKTLNLLKNLIVEHPKGNNGPFSVLISDDNSIFFKNFANSQVTLIDINLNNHRVFSQVQMPVQDMTLIECSNTHKILCLGCVKEKNKYCLSCYVIN